MLFRFNDSRFIETGRAFSNVYVLLRCNRRAYYYGDVYQHNISCCTEEKMLAVKKGLDEAAVPIGYWQWVSL